MIHGSTQSMVSRKNYYPGTQNYAVPPQYNMPGGNQQCAPTVPGPPTFVLPPGHGHPRPVPIVAPPVPADLPRPAARMTQVSNTTARARRGQAYGQVIANMPPVNVHPPRDINIGMLEIRTFFPNWLQIPDLIVRAMRNDWRRKDLGKAQLNATAQLNSGRLDTVSNRIQKQMSDGGILYNGLEKSRTKWSMDLATQHGPDNDLTANRWDLRSDHDIDIQAQSFEHISLAEIIRGVPDRRRWPGGRDRLLLTMCLEYAANNPHLDLDTSHYGWIIQTQGFVDQHVGWGGAAPSQHDIDALDRLRTNVQDPQR